MNIEQGDLVSCIHYSSHTVAVVLNVYDKSSKKPTARILMPNGSVYRFLIDELSLCQKQPEKTMTPFEKSEDFIFSFAEQMYCIYAMQSYVPIVEDLERQSLSAVMSGDMKLVAELAQFQNKLNQQVSSFAFEA